MWKDGTYLNAVGELNSIGERFLHHSHFTADELRKIYSRNRIIDKKFIKAYNSLVILNHFDDLLSSKLGKVLKINENYPKYSAEDRYSLISTGANNSRNWGDKEKDVNMNDHVSDITKLLVETSPIYTWGNSTPIADKKVKLDAFNYIISKIKSLTNSPDIHNSSLTFDGMFFLKYPQFEHLRSSIEGKSFYTLLSSASTGNVLENYHTLFELLCDDSFFNSNYELLRGFRSIEKNLVYSLRQGIFSSDAHSLFGIYKNNVLDTNYYSFICQLVATASPLDFVQYRVNEDGDIVRATLRDNLNRQLRNQLERSISRGKELSIKQAVRSDVLTENIKHAIATGNWVGGRAGVSQLLDRTSYMGTLSHLRRVVSPLTRSQPHFEARDLHPTQFGKICPNETPEGPNCGLVKNLALMCNISEGSDEQEIIDVIKKMNVLED